MEYDQLLELGERLLDNDCESDTQEIRESIYRTVASRAYYAVFHACEAVATRLQLPEGEPVRGGMHEALYSQLLGCTSIHSKQEIEVKKLAYKARSAKQIRVHADYKLNAPFDKETAKAALQSARTLVSSADNIS